MMINNVRFFDSLFFQQKASVLAVVRKKYKYKIKFLLPAKCKVKMISVRLSKMRVFILKY